MCMHLGILKSCRMQNIFNGLQSPLANWRIYALYAGSKASTHPFTTSCTVMFSGRTTTMKGLQCSWPSNAKSFTVPIIKEYVIFATFRKDREMPSIQYFGETEKIVRHLISFYPSPLDCSILTWFCTATHTYQFKIILATNIPFSNG